MRARGLSLSALVVVFGATTIGLAAQTPPPPAVKSPPSAAGQAMSLRGCLETATTGDGFVLRNATNATSVPPTTSAGAGTSATGDAASGSVTGSTPTGSTATDTASPTPAVGTPEASANPASPGYNQSVTAGMTGTVERPDRERPAAIRDFAIVATNGLGLQEHVGHTVEVTGKLTDAKSARAGSEATSEMRAPARKPPQPPPAGTGAAMLTLDVHALHDIATNCSVQ